MFQIRFTQNFTKLLGVLGRETEATEVLVIVMCHAEPSDEQRILRKLKNLTATQGSRSQMVAGSTPSPSQPPPKRRNTTACGLPWDFSWGSTHRTSIFWAVSWRHLSIAKRSIAKFLVLVLVLAPKQAGMH